MGKTSVIILAGGRGKRMDIFCQPRPKPILPFGGYFHVIDFALSNCLNSQIDNIAVLVDYKRSAMTKYLERWSSINTGTDYLTALQPRTGSYSGTAGAVYQNLDYLVKQGGNRTLILAGDHIYRMDYRKMVSFHEETGADATVAVVQVPVEQAYRFGTVSISPDGRITEFIEKSPYSRSNLASMGIYVFNTDFLVKCLSEDAEDLNSPHDFGYAILPRAVKNDRIFAYEFSGFWQDIGTVEAYYQANLQLLDRNPGFTLDNNWPVFTNGWRSPLSPQNNFGNIVNSLISPGCIIEGYVANSILSPGVRVEKGAEVIDSVVMADTSIGDHSIVNRCILDEGVRIGSFCRVGFNIEQQPEKSGITMVGENVNVPDQAVIDCQSRILPGLRLTCLASHLIIPDRVLSVTG